MKHLYVIGNGFDLHHKIKSSYADFKKWLLQNNPRLYNNIDIAYSSTPELWSDLETQLGLINTNSYHKDNFKEICLSTKKDHYIHEFQNHSSEQAFDILIDNLIVSLKSWVNTFSYKNLLPDVSIDKTAFFINFNYTDTLELCYNILPANILHIHGRAATDKTLVLGSGRSSGDIFNDDFYGEIPDSEDHENLIRGVGRIKKPVDKIIHNYKSVFCNHPELEKISIIGFSFSEIDIPYLFEICQKNSRNVNWEIYYHNNEDFIKLKKFTKANKIDNSNLFIKLF